MAKFFLFLGSINAFLTVVLGAFGAHFLKESLAREMMAAYNTAVQCHMYHALALLIVGVIAFYLSHSSMLKWSGCLMLFGIILF